MWGAERTPWHQGVKESKAEGYLNTVNNAPTRLSALPYRQPLLLQLLKVLVRKKFNVGHRRQNHWDAALSCPPPPLFACCDVFKVCALSAYVYVCTFLLYLLCLHMHLLQLDTHSWQNAFLLHMLPGQWKARNLFSLFCFSAIMILRRVPLRRRHGTQHRKQPPA